MTPFASFPSEQSILSISQPVTENYLRTINDLCDLFLDYPHPFVDGTRGPRSGHPSFLLRQFVQLLQRIFHISPSDQPQQLGGRSRDHDQ
jgi:hypothetical protein